MMPIVFLMLAGHFEEIRCELTKAHQNQPPHLWQITALQFLELYNDRDLAMG